jgi:hypothetical protein
MSEQNVLKLPVAPPNSLSNAERERLLKVARLREKVAKSAASARSLELMADFEQQLASNYSFDQDEIWAKAAQAAKAAVEAADGAIAEECERLGIPARFSPFDRVSVVRSGRECIQGAPRRASQSRANPDRGNRKTGPHRNPADLERSADRAARARHVADGACAARANAEG